MRHTGLAQQEHIQHLTPSELRAPNASVAVPASHTAAMATLASSETGMKMYSYKVSRLYFVDASIMLNLIDVESTCWIPLISFNME